MTMEREPQDPLDQNLERLLKVAPERECMDAAVKERLAARLRERESSAPNAGYPPPATTQNAPASSAPIPHAPRNPWRARIALAAAAAVILFLAAQAIKSSTTTPTTDAPGRVADVTPSTGGTSTHPLPPGPDGGPTGSQPLAQGPRRSPAEIASGAAGGPVAAAPDALPPGTLLVAGELRLDDTLSAAPASVTVWVRPMVPLPRVANAERYDLPWTGARSLPFQLEGALDSARQMEAGRVLVHVEAPGAGSTSSIHTLTDAGLSGIALTLSAQETATGFVVDRESGVGIAGAVVIAVDQIPFDALDVHPEKQGRLPATHAITGPSGKFTLRGLRRAESVRLRASAPGFGPGWQTILAAPGADAAGSSDGGTSSAPRFDGTIELGPGGRVYGVVERGDGTRWEGAVVIVSRQDFEPTTVTRPVLTYGSALTDAEGRFEVLDLPSGMYVTLLMGDVRGGSNVMPKAFEFTRVKSGTDTQINFMSVQASAGGALRGVLRSPDGTALGGQSLTVSLTSASSQNDSGWRATTTAEDGTFAFADLDPGHYSIMHSRGGFAEMAAIWSGRVDGPAEVELTLPKGSVLITATLASPRTGPRSESNGENTPATEVGAWAMVERFDKTTGEWDFAGSGFQPLGTSVLIRSLPPGRYRATYFYDRPGNAFAAPVPFDVLDTQLELPIQVPAGDALWIRAEGHTRTPSEGLTVEVMPLAPSPWAGRPLPQQATPITGPNGLAQLRGVPYGEIEIRLSLDGKPVGSYNLAFTKGGPGTAKDPVAIRWGLR